jgi:magnesium chelatase subunit D
VLAPDLPRLLSCVAISDALDGLLVYGATGATLEWLADGLTDRLRAAGARSVDRVWLGSGDTEDTLWGTPGLPRGWGGRGLLVPPGGTTRIIIVPDLSRLSLAAARAGLSILGSRVISVERRGQSREVTLRHRWIAGLAEEDFGSVSRHLLDRFAIRVWSSPASADSRHAELARRIDGEPDAATAPAASGTLAAAARARVRLTHAAITQAMASLERSRTDGMRAPLALLRVAEAITRLDGKRVVDARAVLASARALGLAVEPGAGASSANSGTAKPTADTQEGSRPDAETPAEPRLVAPVPVGVTTQEGTDMRPVDPGDALVVPESTLDTLPVPPDPVSSGDDDEPRAHASLRLPWHQTRAAAPGRGTIVGTRRTETLQDLAVVETLFAAAPFQRLRRQRLGRRSSAVILRRADLRSYRRVPPAGELMVLVLDYTSVADRDWLDTLVPYLAEAYALRAELCVVRVGAASAVNALRADRVMARSVLVPSIGAALDERPGRATPLADGLALAHRTIRQTLGHGRTSTRRATLIVVTDGRGNVPLDASREGRWTGRVGRRGIEDAKRVARDLRDMTHVRCVLIDPGPDVLRDLPLSLAAALGAQVVRVEPRLG